VEERSVSHIAARLYGGQLKIVVAADERLSVWEMKGTGLARAHEARAGHADGVLTLALDEWNGEPVYISGGRDNTVRVWRLADSELLSDTLIGFSGDASAATLVKLQDEHALVTGDTTGTVRLWKGRGLAGAGGRAGASRFEAPSVDELTTIAWNGREDFFIRCRSGALRRVDASKGEPHPLPDGAQRGNFTAVAAANVDGRALLAACDEEGSVTIWDISQASAAGRRLSVHAHTRRLRLVSRDGRLFVIALRSGNLLEWYDVGAGALEAATPLKDIAGAWDLDIAPLGTGFVGVVSGENHVYKLWQWPSDGGELSLFPVPFWTSGIGALATVGGQTVLAHAAMSSEITVAQLEPYREIARLQARFFDPKKIAVREQDGDLLVACGLANGTLFVWRSGTLVAEIETACTITGVAITQDRGVLVAGNEGMLMFDIARLSTPVSSRAGADSRPPSAPSS
jgi:WD40 repeat protein